MAERRPFLFRIAARILLLNVLIVFIPIASILLLDTYEEQLLDALEQSLVQQGRVVAAALSVSPAVDEPNAQALLRALAGRHRSRLRVIDGEGNLLADTSRLAPPATPDPAAASRSAPAVSLPGPRDSLLYRAGSFPTRTVRGIIGQPQTPLPTADFYTTAAFRSGSEVQAALAGRYGATTRVSAGGQISVTLYSALPIERDGQVAGAVLVSQSTFRILQNLYRIRIDVFTIFLWCLAASIVVSVFLSLTIARPIALIERRAREAVDEHGRLRAPILAARRRDEIGGLSRSLSELTSQIQGYTSRLEAFASDVSHELKNPLASIAANCEMALDGGGTERQRRCLHRARADVGRAQAIIEGLRELSRIDARVDPPAWCDIAPALVRATDEARSRYTQHTVALALAPDATGLRVPLPEHRLYQIVENLVGNAGSFSPRASTITIEGSASTDAEGARAVLVIRDEGSGFEEVDRVFDRFYTSRAERDGHLGLGLSIVRSVAESVGGTVRAANRNDGRSGAEVTITLPAVPGEPPYRTAE
ncbi:MAG: ATP-binding protein [Spirochaetales bacterium]|nr:ATP-binding protein [Spirochaetales bacterium]